MTDLSATERQDWQVQNAAERMAKAPATIPEFPRVGAPPYSPKDLFKVAVHGARQYYFASLNQKDPYWAGYDRAKADQMQERAISIAISQGALFSEILPKVELFNGQFSEAPDA